MMGPVRFAERHGNFGEHHSIARTRRSFLYRRRTKRFKIDVGIWNTPGGEPFSDAGHERPRAAEEIIVIVGWEQLLEEIDTNPAFVLIILSLRVILPGFAVANMEANV